MITPILENLVMQGLAKVYHKTLGQGGVCTISVPQNQSIVITKIAIQPFVNPNFKQGFGINAGLGNSNTVADCIKNLLLFKTDVNGQVFNPYQSGNILYEMLQRGTFQIELSSQDNSNTIFTYGTDFNFCPILWETDLNSPQNSAALVALLPALSERSTDCYSVHKNNVHLKLRFFNSAIINQQDNFKAPFDDYTGAVAVQTLNNTIPEYRDIVDINNNNLYFNTAVYSNVIIGGSKFGFYPFGVETNLQTLGAFPSSDTITFPYDTDPTVSALSGDNGEASFYAVNAAGTQLATLRPYMSAFIPYINVEYVLINEKADGQTLVNASRYNTVTINK